jgi:anti-anti-sigma factor
LEEENLNAVVSPNLKSAFILLLKEGVSNLILDLSKVEYADEAGVSAIRTGNQLTTSAGGIFVVTGIQPGVERLFNISQISTTFITATTRQEAVEFVVKEALQRKLEDEGEENK